MTEPVRPVRGLTSLLVVLCLGALGNARAQPLAVSVSPAPASLPTISSVEVPNSGLGARAGASPDTGASASPAAVASAAATERPPDGAVTRRPIVALALSGGGARGAAHVGVLRALEQIGVPIDIITGTSAGAIVGGLYAAGNSPDQIEQVLRSTDWQAALNDSPSRARRSQNNRADERAMIAREVAGVSALEVRAPSALVQGQQFDFMLRNLTLAASRVTDFDRLRVRFRAVATDAVTGDPVVLGSGDLARAIRASMAVPAIFAGVDVDGRLLIDGAVSNNLPISLAREMGADIVIAVDISSPLRTREQLGSLLGMMDQMTGFLTARNTAEQLARLRPEDLLLRPAIDGVDTSDFNGAHRSVALGEVAAEGARARLEAIAARARAGAAPAAAAAAAGTTGGAGTTAVNTAGTTAGGATISPAPGWSAAPDRGPANGAVVNAPTSPTIRFIRFENTSKLRDEMLRAKLGDLQDRPLDLDRLKLGLDRIYALEAFESVRYRLVEEQGEVGLVIAVTPRSWGRDALQFGLRMATERRRGSEFDFGLAYEARTINELNGKWRTELQFGQTSMLATEIYQPLDPSEYWFINARLGTSETLRKRYLRSDAQSEYAISRSGAWLALGANVDRYGDIRVGIRRFAGHTRLVVGTTDPYPRYSFNEGIAFVSAEFENLDSIRFPRSGAHLLVESSHSMASLGASTEFEQVRARFTSAASWGAHTLISQVNLGVTTGGAAPLEARFTMGGLFSMPGYNIDALVGQHLASFGLTYLNSVGRLGLLPIYLGGSWHVGNVWEDRSAIRGNNLIQGRALLVGTDTLIGPVYIGVGSSPGAGTAVYFNLGQAAF